MFWGIPDIKGKSFFPLHGGKMQIVEPESNKENSEKQGENERETAENTVKNWKN